MKLNQIAQFTQGAFANRLETFSNNIETTKVRLLSLKQFNETLGLTYRISNEKSAEITVPKEKLTPQLLTDTNSLILHTHTQKVALLPEKYSGLLLTNNFIKIQLTGNADASFFEWYFNEHPAIQKQLSVLSEGTVISLLKLSHLKNLEIDLPPIQKQITIGKIAQLKKLQESLMAEKRDLQQIYIQQRLIQSINVN
ncbi:restriction endonuclease subunit S [Bacillus velezensis]|uniref:restriction endonuclease subunit S n=1 Tax=Bacillus velezensis TaxID=492670 RepID=UPI00064C9588|nr:restriction endonuclease subunit S [Bacillus velezensis]AKL78464.1 type I restriction-modification system specificity subunit [Bacillus velezensis]MEC2166153.1 restriction endonuclease subunit S [Bacillus velezensis]MED1775867.1 restriction endonuclease subunit S [Bacillus velezensis]RXK25082.1 restriction endonuclease subunit S [Bacillus velezensis]TNU60661.1 restriction endonuclease subunit S [Bacillus velezensis]